MSQTWRNWLGLVFVICCAWSKQTESSLSPKSIIFDVTNIEEAQVLNATKIGKSDKFYQSAVQYLDYKNSYQNVDPGFWPNKFSNKYGNYYKITGLSVLFRQRFSAQQFIERLSNFTRNDSKADLINNVQHNLDALIFRFDPVSWAPYQPMDCRCEDFGKGVKHFFQENLPTKQTRDSQALKIGIKYDNRLIACCNASSASFFEAVDLALFVITINPEKLLLSRNLFLEKFSHEIVINRKFVLPGNSYVQLYIQVLLEKIEGFNDNSAIYYQYLSLLKSYLDVWLQNSSSDELIIMESFPENFKPLFHQLQKNLPILYDLKPFHHWEDFESPCQVQYLFNTISNSFGDLILRFVSFNVFKAIQTECKQYSSFPIFKKQTTNISILLPYTDGKLVEQSLREIIKQHAVNDGLQFDTIYLRHPQFSSVSLVEELLSLGIKVGCHVSDTTVISAIDECGEIFKNNSALLFDTSFLEEELETELPTKLFGLHKERLTFSMMFPEKEFIPAFMITNKGNTNNFYVLIRNIVRQTIYCDQNLQKLYEYCDAILTFFEIYQFKKFVLNSAIHRGSLDGWWNTIETLKTINRTAANFPLLVQRNVPLHLQSSLNLSNQFNCIEWSTSPNENGIDFKNKNYYFGGFVDQEILKNQSLTTKETQTLLLFTFSKFSFLEILANDSIKILTSITHEVAEVITNSSIDNELTYLLEISVDKLISRNTVNLVDSQVLPNSLGIHVSGWEFTKENDNLEILGFLEENFKKWSRNDTNVKFGLTLSNCLEEVNNQFWTVRSSKVIKYVSYVVCILPPIEANNNNKDKMQMVLDTNFYIQTYFKNFPTLQNIRLYFRLKFYIKKCKETLTETGNFLRTINDLNEHSKIYGIRYIIKLFEFANQPDCPSSWWKIANYSDLSDEGIYTEREAYFFGRKTKLNLKLNTTQNERNIEFATNSTQLYIIIFSFSAILLISLTLLAVLWYRYKKIRQRFLSNEEADIFRNGGKFFENGQELIGIIDGLKFDSQFEIERDNIQLGNCIGKGRFGKVFKGLLLSNNLDVAVKLPVSECLKESFLSMLTEVKILCYVGSHPFVIAFVGAYTQDIRKGKLYIVTEYCENGSLQSYLHKMKPERHDATMPFVNQYELCMFSHQIASGMVYISERNIVHGDLSTRNILLNGDLVCKIGDFGLSRRLYENDEYVKKTKEPLPWRWLAIESLKNKIFTRMSDVWSYGITVWEIFTFGDLPFPSKDFTDEFILEIENGLRLSKAHYCSDEIHAKLLNCWSGNPRNRPQFQELSEFFAVLARAEYDM